MGELRTIIALLLLLNRPSLTHYVARSEPTRGWIGNKVRPYMAHTVVTIPLDPIPALRQVGTDNDDPNLRRRHRVRGHFVHDRNTRVLPRFSSSRR